MLIRSGAPIDVAGEETPFLACWEWRKFKAAKFLARKGADVNFQDAKGKTALHHGVQKEFDPALLTWLVRYGASPYIPLKTNSVPQSNYTPKSQLWTRMYHFYMMNRPKFLEHYHKRSNVETTFHMIKSKFGQRLRSQTLTAKINEGSEQGAFS